MYSIYLAKDKIDDDIVFVSGDVYIEPEIGRDFIRNEYADSVIIDDNPKHFTSDDPVKVTIKDSIVAIDKKLSKDNVNGVAIGIYKFSSGLIQKYFKIAADFIEKGHIQYGYIEPIKILINQNKIMPFYIKGKWMDIDTIEEYETAKNLIG
jgi:choline kinase